MYDKIALKAESTASKSEHVILPRPSFPSSFLTVKANTEHEQREVKKNE